MKPWFDIFCLALGPNLKGIMFVMVSSTWDVNLCHKMLRDFTLVVNSIRHDWLTSLTTVESLRFILWYFFLFHFYDLCCGWEYLRYSVRVRVRVAASTGINLAVAVHRVTLTWHLAWRVSSLLMISNIIYTRRNIIERFIVGFHN